jgi:putative membrane protein
VRRDRYALACLAALAAWWAVLAIAPRHRDTWLHENLLVFAGVPLAAWLHLRLRFDRIALTLITLFVALHLFGAHYSYSETPWPFGGRNHYDRVVHFSFGLLLAYPMRELFRQTPWPRAITLLLVMASSMAYELIEWGFVMIAAPAQGMTFLGTQGDEWDAQKDMALATFGAAIALLAMGGGAGEGRDGCAAPAPRGEWPHGDRPAR